MSTKYPSLVIYETHIKYQPTPSLVKYHETIYPTRISHTYNPHVYLKDHYQDYYEDHYQDYYQDFGGTTRFCQITVNCILCLRG